MKAENGESVTIMLDLLPAAHLSFLFLQIRNKQIKTEQPLIIRYALLGSFYLISYEYVCVMQVSFSM